MDSQQEIFQPLSTAEWDRLFPHLEGDNDSLVTLVLTDGFSLVGKLVAASSVLESDSLELTLPFSSDWERVTIPRRLIAGGEIWKPTQSADPSAVRLLPPFAHSIPDAMLRNLIEKQGLTAVRQPFHAMSLNRKVEVREIYPGQSILYAHWQSLARHKRFQGSVSVGFSVYGVGVSVKWEQSIERFVQQRLKGSIWDWNTDLPSGKETIIEAHPAVLLRNRSFVGLGQKLSEDNGNDWVLIVLRRHGVPEHAFRSVWETGAIAAVCNRGLGLPLLHWERIVPPIRFIGEVVKAQIETELGKKAWYLQVLAAGVVESQAK